MSKRGPAFSSCNVLWAAPNGTELWPFEASRDSVKPGVAQSLATDATVPKQFGARDWGQLVKPRLDVAWFPAQGVFLHVLELPSVDPAEIVSMVELQLDKLSPLPVNQVAWCVEMLGPAGAGSTSVLVVLAENTAIQETLSGLEGRGYVADRLEVGLVRELASVVDDDGLWLLVDPVIAPGILIAAWRPDGRWRRVDLLHLPSVAEAVPDFLVKTLTQTAWAAELDGWLESIPPVHLVAPDELVEAWTPALAAWSGRTVQRRTPIPPQELAAKSATEQLRGTAGSLTPSEYVIKNRQKFVDRLWIRGLGTVGVLYLVGVLAYMALLTHRQQQVDDERVYGKNLALQYTNAVALREQVEILEEQVKLRFAALDCYKAIADNLPASMTLGSMNFVRGQTLRVEGTASDTAREDVLKFNSDLQKVTVRDGPLFARVKAARIDNRPGGTVSWSFEAELKRSELQ